MPLTVTPGNYNLFLKIAGNKAMVFLAMLLPLISQAQQAVQENWQAVYSDDFCRDTFYTWTTAEQISILRKDSTLLTKSRSGKGSYSLFDLSLRSEQLKNNVFAQLLQEERFEKKRFAWTNGWATVMGWEDEQYGDQLIKIVLSDSAIVGALDTYEANGEPIRFYDTKGRKLDKEYVIRNKDRIAVVYHFNLLQGRRRLWYLKYPKKTTATNFSRKTKAIEESKMDDIPFREYVILNERMIKTWSYGTKAIRDELNSEIAVLKQFQKSNEAKQTAHNNIQSVWGTRKFSIANDYTRYCALTCFENDYYLFNARRIKAIIERLQSALSRQSAELIKQ